MKKKVLLLLVFILIIGIIVFTVVFVNQKKADAEKENEKSSIETKREYVIGLITENAKIQIFFKQDVSRKQIEEYRDSIAKIEGVTEAKIYTKEEALDKMKERFQEHADVLDGYEENILPDSILVTLSDYKKCDFAEEKIKTIVDSDHVDKITNGYKGYVRNSIENATEEELDQFIELYEKTRE